MTQLAVIIDKEVNAMTTNAVFGSLWRAVCNDRHNEERQPLIDAFGQAVERVAPVSARVAMKEWLNASYDYTAEILEAIESVPKSMRYPAVCLDPTQRFQPAANEDEDEDEASAEITALSRDGLLEIGRSCDYRVLRRLGKVLTQLTFIDSEDDIPAHLAAADDREVPKLPIALAIWEHKFTFWKVLLHLVVPGTMLGARASAVLAALALRMGIEPLRLPAERVMLSRRRLWNNIEIPETWNVSCLGLLLDADKAYRKRRKAREEQDIPRSLLLDSDRVLFEKLVSYKMLEANLETTLQACIGWTPQKVHASIGPIVECGGCHEPRSVTMMGPKGLCGFCLVVDWSSEEKKRKQPASRISTTGGTWVECYDKDCRGQYVVYNPDDLKVRPKCHYCRSGKEKAPLVDCHRCLSRMIYPHEYRSHNFEETTFLCPSCAFGRKTIVERDVTAAALSSENTDSWLLDHHGRLEQVFAKRSLFHVVSTVGADQFAQIELFPARPGGNAMVLTLRGKQLHNAAGVIAQLQSWVYRRRSEQGTCSLCFSSHRKTWLLPACGRRGCEQRVAQDCLKGWYGLNKPGCIINTAALHCPFCRRLPTSKTLAKHSNGVHALRGLQDVMDRSDQFIFAWCQTCGCCKPYAERICARGMPDDVQRWTCEDCTVPAGTIRHDSATTLCVRPCPGCDVATAKTSGCNHITCGNPNCGLDWCFACGMFQADDAAQVYNHMMIAHGGYYDDEENALSAGVVAEIERAHDEYDEVSE